MGGKNKQRTKGNVRPSSSARAAELLARDVGSVPGFLGFGGATSDIVFGAATSDLRIGALTSELGFVPAVQGAEDVENVVDPDFRLVLRKLSKRDTTTKLKAMQEFGAMCKEKDVDVVKAILPYWPRLYNKISTDLDRRVREAAQVAMQQLASRVRRALAPHLKAVMGTWLVAQCDGHAPAASAARAAFSAAFPPAKQPEALAFCKDEILSHLQDNLFKLTPDTLSDPQVSTDEKEARHIRVVTSSLLALKRLLSLLPPGERATLSDRLAALLAQPKLWKYSKHSAPQVRAALYEALSALCRAEPELARGEARRLCPTVLLALDETDPVACAPLWEAALLAASTIEDCWTHVSVRKGVLPRLWAVLREGGRGLAAVVHPHLLPLLGLMPPAVTGPRALFYPVLFCSLRQGLGSDTVQSSPSERAAIVRAFTDCFRLAVHESVSDGESGEEEGEEGEVAEVEGEAGGGGGGAALRKALLCEQLLPLVELAIADPKLQQSPVFAQLSELLAHWGRRSEDPDLPPNQRQAYCELLAAFWESVGSTCLAQVGAPQPERALLGVAALLSALRQPGAGMAQPSAVTARRAKKPGRIRFAPEPGVERAEAAGNGSSGGGGGAEETAGRIETGATDAPGSDDSTGASEDTAARDPGPDPSGPLPALCRRAARLGLSRARELGSLPHLDFLSAVLALCPTDDTFRSLLGEDDGVAEARASRPSDVRPEARPSDADERERAVEVLGPLPALRFLRDALLPWLGECRAPERAALVEVLFSVLRACRDQRQRADILDDVCKMNLGPSVLLLLIQKACADTGRLRLAQAWLMGPVLTETLVVTCRRLCRPGQGKQAASGGAAAAAVASLSAEQADSWALLSLALSSHADGKPLLPAECVRRVVSAMRAALPRCGVDGAPTRAEPCVSLVCDVACSFFGARHGGAALAAAEDLISAIFRLACQSREKDAFTDELREKLSSTWKAGLTALLTQQGGYMKEGGFLHSTALWVKERIMGKQISPASLDVLGAAVCSLVDVALTSGLPTAHPVPAVLRCLLPSAAEWDLLRAPLLLGQTQSLTEATLIGRLPLPEHAVPEEPGPCSPTPGDDYGGEDGDAADDAAAPAHLSAVSLLSRLVGHLQRADERSGRADGDEGTAAEIGDSEEREADSRLLDPACCLELACECMLADTWCRLSRSGPAGPSLPPCVGALCWGLVGAASTPSTPAADPPLALSQLLGELFNRSVQHGGLWALALSHALPEASRRGLDTDVKALYGSVEWFSEPTEAKLHTAWALAPFLPRSDAHALVDVATALLMSCSPDARTRAQGARGCLSLLSVCLLSQPELPTDGLHRALDTLSAWRDEESDDVFLFARDVSGEDGAAVACNVEMMRFLRGLLFAHSPLSHRHWDFLLCSMLSWLQSTGESLGDARRASLHVLAFAAESCRLLASVADLLQTPPPGAAAAVSAPPPESVDPEEASAAVPPHLFTEWAEFFADGAYSLLLPAFVSLCAGAVGAAGTGPGRPCLALLQATAQALGPIPVEQLHGHRLPPRLVAGQRSHLPDALQTALNTLAPLLGAPARPVQLAAFHMLDKLMPELPAFDTGKAKPEDEGETESCLSPPAALMSVLASLEEELLELLSPVPVGEPVRVEPLTPAYHTTLGYLLAWKLLLSFFQAASSELRVQYSGFIREQGSLSRLLEGLFRLMPESPALPSAAPSLSGAGSCGGATDKVTRSMFTEPPPLALTDDGAAALPVEVPHVACCVYAEALRCLPAMVRLWWNNQDKRVSGVVERFTSRHASPVLSAQEIAAVQATGQRIHDMTVRARPAAREVVATYNVEEVYMELVVTLPPNHPLGPVAVECGKRVGVASQQWWNWMLQLSTFLTHQNGSIMDGLALWKANVDKRFEGVEECTICYSVIHGSNYSLPRKACRTCRKKFHAACLYKWFTSSNKSTCPLCRETFF
ncbi:E3 ubiquitin-protein ligase listerin isoform X1 [Lampetra planeri]